MRWNERVTAPLAARPPHTRHAIVGLFRPGLFSSCVMCVSPRSPAAAETRQTRKERQCHIMRPMTAAQPRASLAAHQRAGAEEQRPTAQLRHVRLGRFDAHHLGRSQPTRLAAAAFAAAPRATTTAVCSRRPEVAAEERTASEAEAYDFKLVRRAYIARPPAACGAYTPSYQRWRRSKCSQGCLHAAGAAADAGGGGGDADPPQA